VPLKKPSDFFNDKRSKSPLDLVKEDLDLAAPDKIENISEAFNSFKSNLNHLQNLSDFTSTFDSFSDNIEKVNSLFEEIETLKRDLQNFIKKEDIDDVVMAQILFVEESIKEVQNKVKTINSKTLINLKKEVSDISEKINDFINIEFPSQKNFLFEVREKIDSKIVSNTRSIESKLEEFDNNISDRFLSIIEAVKGINNDQLSDIKEEVLSIDGKVNHFIENDLQKYSRFFAEYEIKSENRISSAEERVDNSIKNIEEQYQRDILSLKNEFNEFVSVEVPRYKNILVESKIKNEEEIKTISDKIDKRLDLVSNTIEKFDEEIKNNNTKIDEVLSEKIAEVKNFIDDIKSKIEKISSTYEGLYKDFKSREIYENEKLEKQSSVLDDFSKKISDLENNLTEDISDLQNNLDISTSKYFDILKNEVGYFEQNISEKISDLQINFVRNEKHIQDARKDIQDALSRLNIEQIEKKNKNLTDKIIHLESILEKFDDKKILSEDASLTLAEPPSIKNKDPLTPLDQNYVTIKDLQDHYRIFINRVQQQLATIGGGGAGFVKDLSDVSFNESTGQNKLLIYNGSNWVGIASTELSSGSSTLVSLTDVNSSNLGDGRFLRYDASTSEFTFAPVSASNLELEAGDIQSGILTTNSTSPAVVMSISAITYRSVNYQIQVTEGTNYNMTIINILHDGTTPYILEYGTINQPIGIATFSANISGGSLRLIGYPSFASPTTFKVVFTAIEA
jgi:DNA repair exonuclease SbcCD ATPase subunit